MKTKHKSNNSNKTPPKPFSPTRLPGFTVLVEASSDGSQLDLLYDQTFQMSWNARCTHTLVVGKSGSGKTTRLVLPAIFSDIADPHRSVFVLDAQAEEARRIIEYTRRVRGPDARIIYINLEDPKFSDHYNLFEGVRSRKDADDIADTMSASVDQGSGDSPYFRMQARKNLSAFVRGMNNSKERPATGGKILSLLDGGLKAINEFAQKTKQPELRSLLANLQNGNRNDETSLSELNNLVGAFSDEDVVETTSRSDFDFSVLDDEPCVVIYSIHEESVERLRPVTNAIIHRLFHFVMERGRANGGSLRRPLSAFFDEFASAVGRIPNFQKRANTLRKRGLAITAAVQSLAQIYEVYRESASSLIAAFSNLIFVSPVSWDDAVQASNLGGVMTVEDIITSDGNTPVNVVPVKRPVLTPDEISNPPRHPELGPRITFLLANTPPFQGWLRPAFDHPEYRDIMNTKFTGPLPLPVKRRLPIQTQVITVSAVDNGTNTILPGITNTVGWNDDEIRVRLEAVKQQIGWGETTGTARKWWEAFENENRHRLALVLRLAEELLARKATATDFFLAYVYSNTDNLQANLHYLDYTLLKKEVERKQRESQSPPPTDSQ